MDIYARQDYGFQLIGDLPEVRIPFVRFEDPHAEAGPNISSFMFFQVTLHRGYVPRTGAYDTGSCGTQGLGSRVHQCPLCPHLTKTTLSFLVVPSYSTLLGAGKDKKPQS